MQMLSITQEEKSIKSSFISQTPKQFQKAIKGYKQFGAEELIFQRNETTDSNYCSPNNSPSKFCKEFNFNFNRIAQDKKAIVNRIMLLKKEENKAKKRMEEIKRKTNDILLKNQSYSPQIIKERSHEIYMKNVEKVKEIKEGMNKVKGKYKEMINNLKFRDIQNVKKQLQELNNRKKENIKKDREFKKQIIHFVHRQEQLNKQKILHNRTSKKKEIVEYFEKIKKEDENYIINKEEEISNLEKYEQSLIQKFQNTNIQQDNALSELKKAYLFKRKNLKLSNNSAIEESLNNLYSNHEL